MSASYSCSCGATAGSPVNHCGQPMQLKAAVTATAVTSLRRRETKRAGK